MSNREMGRRILEGAARFWAVLTILVVFANGWWRPWHDPLSLPQHLLTVAIWFSPALLFSWLADRLK